MNLTERLAAKLRREPSGCLVWTGCLDGQGYGVIGIGGRHNQRRTHVLAWELAHDQRVPAGICVCHACDNRPCCESAHLFLGTTADNIADMNAKRRHAFGERHGMARLTGSQVTEIRAALTAGRLQKSVAAQYGVSKQAISKIARNQRWKELA